MLNESKDGLGQSSLTSVQQERLARVRERGGDDEYINPNMADTPCHLAEHGLAVMMPGGNAWFKATPEPLKRT